MTDRRTDGGNDAFADTGKHGFFTCATNQAVDIRPHGHAGDRRQLNSVFGHRRNPRRLDHLRIDTHLHRFEHVTACEIDCGCPLEMQRYIGLVGCNKRLHHPQYISPGEKVRFKVVAFNVKSRLDRHDLRFNDQLGRYFTEPHEDDIEQTDTGSRNERLHPERQSGTDEENDDQRGNRQKQQQQHVEIHGYILSVITGT